MFKKPKIDGIYLLDKDKAEGMPSSPLELDLEPSKVAKVFGGEEQNDHARGLAAAHLLSYARSFGNWVEIDLHVFTRRSRVPEMLNEGMNALISEGCATMRIWDDNGEEKRTISPTPEMIRRIVTYKAD